ncbi:MAG TPA: hypothetical protein VH475_28845 [Tepidisphaeraceae bacterium]
MISTDLTPEQAKHIGEIVRRHLAYLGELRARMERVWLGSDLRDQIDPRTVKTDSRSDERGS